MHTKYNGDARKALYELRQIYYRDKLSDDYGFTDLSKIITQQDNESMKGTKLKQKYEEMKTKIDEVEKKEVIFNYCTNL